MVIPKTLAKVATIVLEDIKSIPKSSDLDDLDDEGHRLHHMLFYMFIPNSRACWGSIFVAGTESQKLAALKIRNGTLEPWNLGTLEPWNLGTLEPWNPEPWNPGTLEPGTFELRNLRT